MTVGEILQEIESLVPSERAEVIRKTLTKLYPQNGKTIDRLLRRLEHPDVPESIWRIVEQEEDSRTPDSGGSATQRFFRKNP